MGGGAGMMFRSLTDEQLAERHDPHRAPCVAGNEHSRREHFRGDKCAPRVECIPSRDGKKHGVIMTGAGTPPLCFCGWQGKNHSGPILADHLREVARPPVNRVLADLRSNEIFLARETLTERVLFQIEYLKDDFGRAALNDGLYTPAEIEHGLLVLDRLKETEI